MCLFFLFLVNVSKAIYKEIYVPCVKEWVNYLSNVTVVILAVYKSFCVWEYLIYSVTLFEHLKFIASD